MELDRLPIEEPVSRAIEATSLEAANNHLTVTVLDRHGDARVSGPLLLAESHRLKTVCGFIHNQPASFLEEAPQPASHDAVVVSQQHAHAASP
jgi:hypothetical protein